MPKNSLLHKIFLGGYGGYVFSSFARETVHNPGLMKKAMTRYIGQTFFGKEELPTQGIKFEHHCHSHYSDGPELGKIVDFLFNSNTRLWSLTDHGNSDAFDALASGRYRISGIPQYEIELNGDGRSMIIHCNDKQLILLRSIEKTTHEGEIGIHAYAGNFPKERIPLTDVIKKAHDGGGFVIINHPYLLPGIGYRGRKHVFEAAKNGAIAIEITSTEIPPLIFGHVRAQIDAKETGISIVSSGDAHFIDTYGKSGLVFSETEYSNLLRVSNINHADTIMELIRTGRFDTYLNFLSLNQFYRMFNRSLGGSFDIP